MPIGPITPLSPPARAFLALLLLTGVPLPALAGRPVVHDLTLPQLVSRADAIAVVRAAAPFRPTTESLADGCLAEVWPLTLEEVVHRAPQAGPTVGLFRPGTGLRILINPTAVVDCGARKGSGSRGVSFPASRYRSSLGLLSRPAATMVVFLNRREGRWQLVCEGAFEDVSRLGPIRQLLAMPSSSPGSPR